MNFSRYSSIINGWLVEGGERFVNICLSNHGICMGSLKRFVGDLGLKPRDKLIEL